MAAAVSHAPFAGIREAFNEIFEIIKKDKIMSTASATRAKSESHKQPPAQPVDDAPTATESPASTMQQQPMVPATLQLGRIEVRLTALAGGGAIAVAGAPGIAELGEISAELCLRFAEWFYLAGKKHR